ncbi:hypothetical protein B0J14DRAFT_272522 [Halenospora varia]|nr:hypothetical protein B0J14DRAFT_272522 [Halenospora varia]
MSGYRPGHDGNPYIDQYAPPTEQPPEERVFGSHPAEIQHGGGPGLQPSHDPYGAHQQQQQQQHHQQPHHPQQHQVYPGPLAIAPNMAHHQSSQYGGGQNMMYPPPRQMQPSVGTKRQRDDDELEGMGLPLPQHMGPGDMGGMPQHMQHPDMIYGASPGIQYHTHGLPPNVHQPKRARGDDPNSQLISSPTAGGAPSVVGNPGMPEPAPRPRGPKLKFTPEDDQKLVDLKENKNLTWKQIAEFFPGRSSGTLQVRYCTKLKAKTTQWTEETIQKLRTALHDYEQEKWRIIAQKVGTGFTSTACREKAMEL